MTRKHYVGLSTMLLALLVTACGNADSAENNADTGENAEAEGSEDYYAGKTITWIISGSTGGGTDVLTRTYAPLLSECLPGNPNVEFEYKEGGGGIEATNFIYNVAEPDGLTIATLGSQPMLAELSGEDAVQYDYTEVTFLGNFLGRDQMLWLRGDFGVSTFEELLNLDDPVKIGARTPTHGTAALPLVLGAGYPDQQLFEMVYGYEGGADVDLDVERGALVGRSNSVGSLQATNPDWLDSGFLVPIVYAGAEPHPDFADVPTVDEVMPPEHKELINLLRAPALTTRVPAAPPGLPDDIAQTLLDGFECMAKDADVEKAVTDLGYPFQVTSADEVQEAVSSVLSSDTLAARYKELTSEEEL